MAPILLLTFVLHLLVSVYAVVRPSPLYPGNAVRIVATGGAVKPSFLAAGSALLREGYGLKIRQDPSVLDVDLYFAGVDTVRAANVLQALRESDTLAIWAARGGYGTARLLDLPDFNAAVIKALAVQPRWLIGSSDVTALHILWAHADVLSVYGSTISDLPLSSTSARDGLFDIVGGTTCITLALNGTTRHKGTRGNTVRGKLLGGNLSVLSSLVGSGYLPNLNGAILLVEDIDEEPYRLDRLLTQLLRAEESKGIAAIAFGQLTNADLSTYTALELLDRTLEPLQIPVITNLPIGHNTATSVPVVLGSDAEVDVGTGQLVMSIPAFLPKQSAAQVTFDVQHSCRTSQRGVWPEFTNEAALHFLQLIALSDDVYHDP